MNNVHVEGQDNNTEVSHCLSLLIWFESQRVVFECFKFSMTRKKYENLFHTRELIRIQQRTVITLILF